MAMRLLYDGSCAGLQGSRRKTLHLPFATVDYGRYAAPA
ncbi:Unknown protein sequence [Pseudomonas coronafaciens pv. oryzae]|nr:Unknown protein sequence [Pseudomonas coronafaciens pv. oryzae]